MRWLQNVSIQSRLIGTFAVILLAGVVLLGWNIVTISHSKEVVHDTLQASNTDIQNILQANKADVTTALNDSMDDATMILEQMDALLILQILATDFRELEALEKELVMYDAEYADETAAYYEEMSGYLEEDLELALELVTDEDTAQVVRDLQEERVAQREFFYQLVDLMETDPDEAFDLSADASEDRIDTIYNVLEEIVGSDWDATFEDFEQTWARVEATIADTETRMQTAIDATDANVQATIDQTETDLQTTIRVGLIAIGLFVAAGAAVAGVIVLVSRQIVRPVYVMAQVAEGIEQDTFETQTLEPITHRQDEIGLLARVFQRMAKEVYARMEHLKQQVAELQIVIDTQKVAEQVSEITDTDYFQALQAKAKTLRERFPPASAAPQDDTEDSG